MVVAATLAGINKEDQMYYYQERHFFTFFSAVLLVLTSHVSFTIHKLMRKMKDGCKFLNFWLISAVGFFYLCLDEYFIIHEGMDRAILKAFDKNPHLVNFDGWILGLIGVGGLCVVYHFRWQILKFREFVILFGLATFFFGLMVLADEFLDYAYPALIFEEIFKILGVAFFYVAYSAVLRRLHDQLNQNS